MCYFRNIHHLPTRFSYFRSFVLTLVKNANSFCSILRIHIAIFNKNSTWPLSVFKLNLLCFVWCKREGISLLCSSQADGPHNVLFKPSVCESEERNKLAYREQLEQLVSVDELKGCKVVDELVEVSLFFLLFFLRWFLVTLRIINLDL